MPVRSLFLHLGPSQVKFGGETSYLNTHAPEEMLPAGLQNKNRILNKARNPKPQSPDSASDHHTKEIS